MILELLAALLFVCVISCLPVSDKGKRWEYQPERPEEQVYSQIVPQEEADDSEGWPEDQPIPAPEPYVPTVQPTPEQVGSWTIYRFPKRISIPTPEK